MFLELDGYNEMVDFVGSHEKVVVSIRPKGGCKICEIYAPHFKKAMKELLAVRDDFQVVIVPVDEECVRELGVCSPTVILFKKGKEVKRIIVEKVPEDKFEDELKNSVNEAFI